MPWAMAADTSPNLFGRLRALLWPSGDGASVQSPPRLTVQTGAIATERSRRRTAKQARGIPRPDAIGAPEDEVDPEVSLASGQALLGAGRNTDAQHFFRQAPRLAASRRAAGAMAVRAAIHDFDFQRLVEQADRARDAAEWRKAAELYREALEPYPDHFGYIVQYAHCLKEQGQLVEAECHYRSALALGEPWRDVQEHLNHVASQQGFPANFERDAGQDPGDSDPFDALPAKADVELLVFLLLGREPAVGEIVQLLRKHRSVRSLFLAIVEDRSFALANAAVLARARHRQSQAGSA